MTEGDSAKVLVDGIRVGWTGQSPDRTTEKGEKKMVVRAWEQMEEGKSQLEIKETFSNPKLQI
jgi:hypothetical protein